MAHSQTVRGAEDVVPIFFGAKRRKYLEENLGALQIASPRRISSASANSRRAASPPVNATPNLMQLVSA
ncbi:MAG: hypothetical protein QOE70_5059 [Chthoniobacter sp.]|jgi:hypothetical protein|nr:hypothetical protein [Chthoniobacter sp.]